MLRIRNRDLQRFGYFFLGVGLTAFLLSVFYVVGKRFVGDATHQLPAMVAMILVGSSTAIISAFLLSRNVSSPLSELTQAINAAIESQDYSAELQQPEDHVLNPITTGFNKLLSEIQKRNEAIRLHETMEEGLGDWIKEWHSHEKELKMAKSLAESASVTKSQFLASVSHELRTPLHTILSYARFGMRDAQAGTFDEVADHFEVIHDSGDYLLLLLNDLLDLSKLESGKLTFEMSPVSLGDLMGAAIDEFQTRTSVEDVVVELGVAEPDLILADATRMMQVGRNLIDNAIKYSPRNGIIHVDIDSDENSVTLRVRDHGDGVPEDELDTIFDKFTQSSSTKRDAGGTGLGLSICQQIVMAQKGRIWAANHPDGGLTVFVQFPLCKEPVPV